MKIFDGLVNVLANLGTARDKAAHSNWYFTPLDDGALETAYRASPLARKIVDMPAEDAGREWREWQAEADQITAIEAEEKRLGVQAAVIRARKAARLWGGAAIYMHGPGNPALPMNPRAIQQGGLRYIAVLARHELTEGEIQRDPRLPGYGKPAMYSMNTGTAQVQIHPSRLVIMNGRDLPPGAMMTNPYGWGDSVLNGSLEAATRVDATAGNIASLVFEAKVDVIRIAGLMKGFQDHGTEYETALRTRLSAMIAAVGNNGKLVLDKDDEYDQKSASFAGLSDVLDRFMQLMSAVSGIPMTLLFGTSPGGLNATGESDTRGYYDRVRVVQTLEMGPAMETFDECLIRSALGDRPEEVHYNWRPLWQPTAKERAEVGKLQAETLQIGRTMGAASDEAIGKTFVNALTESGAFPGLEAAAEEFPVEELPAPEMAGVIGLPGDDPAEMGAQTPDQRRAALRAVGDATPRTLYVHRKVLNGSAILAWAKGQGFKTTLPADDLHVTITFSRAPVDWMKMGEAWDAEMKVAPGGPRLMERFGEANVLLFTASELRWRHERMIEEGASWDHPEYQPHITISYDPDAPDLAQVEPYQGEIVLGPEIFSEVDEDWKAGVTE